MNLAVLVLLLYSVLCFRSQPVIETRLNYNLYKCVCKLQFFYPSFVFSYVYIFPFRLFFFSSIIVLCNVLLCLNFLHQCKAMILTKTTGLVWRKATRHIGLLYQVSYLKLFSSSLGRTELLTWNNGMRPMTVNLIIKIHEHLSSHAHRNQYIL